MIISINGVDVTNNVILPTFKINRSEDFSKSCEFSLVLDTNEIKGGQELIVSKNSNILFGGIINNLRKKMLSDNLLSVDIKASGYEVLMTKRTIKVSYTDKHAGYIVSWIVDNILNSEGITSGNIENGIFFSEKSYYCSNVRDIIDEIAIASGFIWWIDNDKKLNFCQDKSYTNAIYDLDTDEENDNRLIDVEYPEYEEDMSKYANKIFLLGSLDEIEVFVIAENALEIARMNDIYGTGVYGKVIESSDIKTLDDAEDAARVELEKCSSEPIDMKFSTRQDGLDINQEINVNLPILGIINKVYVINNINITCYIDGENEILNYDINIRNIITLEGKPINNRKTWEDELKKFKNYTASSASSGVGGNIVEYNGYVYAPSYSSQNPIGKRIEIEELLSNSYRYILE
jgi:hypothetical protein